MPDRRDDMIVALVGPTAVGKSDLAIALAQRVDAEIVSADSMQVYVGMDIGTAKVPPAERGGVAHHMIDVWSPDHDVSVVEFRDRARARVREIEQRGGSVIVVGGSWLYVQAILDEMDFPGTDPQIRARLEADLLEVGAAQMHARLAELDAAAADAILPTNGRRIVRALEVVELRGSFTARLPEPRPWRATHWIGMSCDRLVLDARITERVDRMWAAGLVDEVRRLAPRLGRTARGALGYRQVVEALETAGEVPVSGATVHRDDEKTATAPTQTSGDVEALLERARLATVEGTRKFARRQERRFRQDQRVQWVPAGSGVDEVLRRFGSPDTWSTRANGVR
jgi:tRNA dimethylallyltransferase